MRITTSLKKMTRKQIKKICKIIIRWCVDHLGENHRIKKELRVKLDYIEKYEGKAEYDIDEEHRIITIYVLNAKTIKDLICDCIHEMVHDVQPVTTRYDKLYKKYYYKNHPFEKAARKMEDRFYKVCWGDIRPKVEKLFDK